MAGIEAHEISVSQFRQIYHLPLVWRGDVFELDTVVSEITSNVDLGWDLGPLDPSKIVLPGSQTSSFYDEVTYFHDFLRDFLFPTRNSLNQRLLIAKCDDERMTASFGNGAGTHEFLIERRWLRLFSTGIAILTLELKWITEESGKQLTLAQVQTITDHLRRIYTPFWYGENPARIPEQIEGVTTPNIIRQTRAGNEAAMVTNMIDGTFNDPPRLEPWEAWAKAMPAEKWRMPSDERIPVMSFVALQQVGSARDTMGQIKKADWFRILEADESASAKDNAGQNFEYNPDFLRKRYEHAFFDRFAPSQDMPEVFATRHLFGGAHYAMVTVDDGKNIQFLEMHFRRHYEKMALIARFEFASLLAFSSRVSSLVKKTTDKSSPKTSEQFRKEMLNIREDFLEFNHLHRFTGVSSQIQAAEMFDRWRASLELQSLYEDVRDEISAASDFATAQIALKQAEQDGNVATVGTILAAILAPASFLSIPGMEGWLKYLAEFCGIGLGVFALIAYSLLAGLTWWVVQSIIRKPESPSEKE